MLSVLVTDERVLRKSSPCAIAILNSQTVRNSRVINAELRISAGRSVERSNNRPVLLEVLCQETSRVLVPIMPPFRTKNRRHSELSHTNTQGLIAI